MEIIELPGYTQGEKLKIAFRYLLPRQIEQNGLRPRQIGMSWKAMEKMISGYTREAGLRNLERTIGKVCRKVARQAAEGKIKKAQITAGNLAGYLGPEIFTGDDAELGGSRVGVATGLAWTQAGGEILHIEASFVDGRGGLTLTGHLGEVMKESAQAALTYARSRASRFGVDKDFFSTHDLHIHVPAGAIPKDGPSAGITMATAVTSAMLGRATVGDLAMTGEVTLRGAVLPVGGIKEKVLAAQRAGKSNILMPLGNKKDVVSIPPLIRRKLTLHFVKSMDEVLELALAKD
jgi:ATP-dependent Lon protease